MGYAGLSEISSTCNFTVKMVVGVCACGCVTLCVCMFLCLCSADFYDHGWLNKTVEIDWFPWDVLG
jgi:hypothetical protein